MATASKDSVTILVSVLNMQNTIKSCVDSLLRVDYPNKKIMIVDGYSADGTFEILKKYSKKIELYRVKGNVPTAWDFAIDRIKTNYIAFTDGDCIVAEDWLRELMKGFSEKGVIAVAGYCGTPKKVSPLQAAIGIELEERFKHFPRYITRAPTMNLCVKTNFAKKVKFDRKLDTASEVDFGYRLTKLGKMLYNSKAKVVHYHRTSWKTFFKQQKNYAKYLFLIYLKHPSKSKGDHISKPIMVIQIPLFFFFLLFLVLSLFNKLFMILSCIFLFLLVGLYVKEIIGLKQQRRFFFFLKVYCFRTFAWFIGVTEGVLLLIKRLL